MRIAAPIRHIQKTHVLDGVVAGENVQIRRAFTGVRVKHQNRRFLGVRHAIRRHGGKAGRAQGQQHGEMMLHGVADVAVSAGGDAGETQPIPQLLEIAGGVRLRVEYGNHISFAACGAHIVDAGSLHQVVVQRCVERTNAGMQFLIAYQCGDIETDVLQRVHQFLAPDAGAARADREADDHAKRPAGEERHQHAADRMPGQHHHKRGRGIQDVPSPFHRRSDAARAGRGQESRHGGIDARQQSRVQQRSGGNHRNREHPIRCAYQYGQSPSRKISGEHAGDGGKRDKPFAGEHQLDEHGHDDDDGGKLLQYGGGNVGKPVDGLCRGVYVGLHAAGDTAHVHGEHHDYDRADER